MTTSPLTKRMLLWRFMQGSKRFFIISILTSLVITFVDTAVPQVIRYTVDTVLGDKPSEFPALVNEWIDRLGGVAHLRTHLWILAIAVGCLALLSGISRYLQRVFSTIASETLVRRMRHLLFSHIQHLPFSWHMQNRTGDIIQRCTSDVETVKNFLSEQLISIFRIVIQIAVSLFVMYSMNISLAIAATVTLPFILVYSTFFGGRIRSRFKECDEAEGVLSAIAQENLTGVRVVRAFGRESYERDRFGAQNIEYTNRWLRLSRLMSAFWGVGDFIAGIQVMLILILGVLQCTRGQMTAGDFIAFMSYNTMLSWPIRRLGRMISELSKAGISVDRLHYILASPAEQDRPHAVEPDLRGDIVFDDVSFGYSENDTLLSHISFTAKSGQTIGILGGTGSGKSTLMHLLNRLYPLPEDGSGGRITIGGVDIADMKAEHLRRGVGMVLQEPYLFSRSIADNIAIATEGISDEDIREAARIACLDDTVNDFAEGYDTFVGERGVTLSGGQKQRAAIARMLTQKTPIMVFDDSLSAVDAETDARIRAALNEHLGDSTVFLISHRTATLMHADLILVLENGSIAESGTHKQLMARHDGIYRRIYELQLAGAFEEEVSV